MKLSEFLQQLDAGSIFGGCSVSVVILLTLIQSAPIKFNPWSWLARTIGRAFNREMLDRLGDLEKDVKKIQAENEEQKATGCRSAILRFGDEIRHGTRHSKEHFDQILIDISFYEHYCDTHRNFENNIALMTIEKIKDTYRKCLDEDSFL